MKRAAFLFLLGLVVFSAGQALAVVPEPARRVALPDVVNGGNAFGLALYQKLAAAEKGNLFFSPASIHMALAMTYGGAAGRTAAEMAKALRFPKLPARDLHGAFGALLLSLNTPRTDAEGKPAFELVVANAVWLQKGLDLLKDFVDLLKGRYAAGLNQSDFAKDPEAARAAINAWVAKQTRDKIKELIPPGLLSSITRLVLVNAVYFKSNWEEPFSTYATFDGEFKAAAGKATAVRLMRNEASYGYLETAAFQACELPYRLGELSLVVFLPKKVDGLAAFERTLEPKSVAKWLAGLKRERVLVTLPKFKIESAFSLGEALKKLGLVEAFLPGKADFTAITKSIPLFISAVVHKAFVAVDEKGTEAAAATAVVMAEGAKVAEPPKPRIFRADHPFLFLIRHRATGAILFLGRLVEPKA